jgi:hypothetical protein
MSVSEDVRAVEVSAAFRHSAGRLGSRFLKALRDEKRILGWCSANRVVVPPKDFGCDGEWIEVGPGARLEAYAPANWLRDMGRDADDCDCLALVKLDGADTALLTRVRRDASAAPFSTGLRLKACFADERTGSINDLWFEPAQV